MATDKDKTEQARWRYFKSSLEHETAEEAEEELARLKKKNPEKFRDGRVVRGSRCVITYHYYVAGQARE